ncbi:MAG: hypothetical protein R3Y26_06190 [Rikenellaceae bacterium]
MRKILALLISLGLCYSCTDNVTSSSYTFKSDNLRAIIVSEGQFGYGTGSVTALYEGNAYVNDVFSNVNGRPIGDVPQSITKIGANYYIPVNNSQKVEVVSATTFESVETMVLEHSTIPMFVEYLGGDSVIVSDQSSSAIVGSSEKSSLMIMDINHGEDRDMLRRLIPVDFPTQQMKLHNNKLFVGGTQFSVFDLNGLESDKRRDILTAEGNTIEVAGFSKICVDNSGYIWVLSGAGVYCVNPITEVAIKEISVEGIDTYWGNIDIDADGRWLYFNSGSDIYAVDTQNPTTPTQPIFTHDNDDALWTTYGLSTTEDNTIMISRVLFGSITRGRIFEYNLSGNIVNYYTDDDGEEQPYFRAGIFPRIIHVIND